MRMVVLEVQANEKSFLLPVFSLSKDQYEEDGWYRVRDAILKYRGNGKMSSTRFNDFSYILY